MSLGARDDRPRGSGAPPVADTPPARTMEEALEVLRDLAAVFFPIGEADTIPASTERPPVSPEQRYRTLVEQIPAITFMAGLDGSRNDLYVSPQIERMLGFTQEEWLSDPVLWWRQLHPDDRQRANDEFVRGCLAGGPFRGEFRALTRDDRTIWIRGEATVIRDEKGRPLYIQGIAYDVTEAKNAEAAVRESTRRLRESLEEKEVLLKEVHHRVKNNLQIISSLLKLQSGSIRDPATIDAFRVSQHRVQSMALVHEKLYGSAELSRIDFAEYARSLTALLSRSYGMEASNARMQVELEGVFLGIDVAIPLGLILNELVSNALKYAFPEGGEGTIRIALQNTPEGEAVLTVADDGIGLPEDFDLGRNGSLGIQLVQNLARQIGSRIEIERDGGTTFRISLPPVRQKP